MLGNLFVLITFICVGIDAIADYHLIALTDDGQIIDQCFDQCYETNCSLAALQVYNCPGSSWIAFIPIASHCAFFRNHTYDSGNEFIVWVVDQNRHVIPETTWRIKKYFNAAVNYGCIMLSQIIEAKWIGMQFMSH